jgi:hypothetical protein
MHVYRDMHSLLIPYYNSSARILRFGFDNQVLLIFKNKEQ